MDRVFIAFSSHRELKPSTKWTRLVPIFEFVPELKRSVCPLGIRQRLSLFLKNSGVGNTLTCRMCARQHFLCSSSIVLSVVPHGCLSDSLSPCVCLSLYLSLVLSLSLSHTHTLSFLEGGCGCLIEATREDEANQRLVDPQLPAGTDTPVNGHTRQTSQSVRKYARQAIQSQKYASQASQRETKASQAGRRQSQAIYASQRETQAIHLGNEKSTKKTVWTCPPRRSRVSLRLQRVARRRPVY